MTNSQYKSALDAACREYERLLAERAVLDDRLSKLQETIASLMRLCGYEPTVPWGITDAVRVVLQREDASLTAVDVRERLRAAGFDLSKYSSELSTIHTVLKRLHRAGELHYAGKRDGSPAYRRARIGTIVLDHPHTFVPGRKR